MALGSVTVAVRIPAATRAASGGGRTGGVRQVDHEAGLQSAVAPSAQGVPGIDAGGMSVAPVERDPPRADQLGIFDREVLALPRTGPGHLAPIAHAPAARTRTGDSQPPHVEAARPAVVEGERH